MSGQWLRIDTSKLDEPQREIARTLAGAMDTVTRAVRVDALHYYPFRRCEEARDLLHERYGLPLEAMAIVGDL